MLVALAALLAVIACISAVLGYGTIAAGVGVVAGYLAFVLLAEWVTSRASQPHVSHHPRS